MSSRLIVRRTGRAENAVAKAEAVKAEELRVPAARRAAEDREAVDREVPVEGGKGLEVVAVRRGTRLAATRSLIRVPRLPFGGRGIFLSENPVSVQGVRRWKRLSATDSVAPPLGDFRLDGGCRMAEMPLAD
jgi:hypothetical protein